MYGSILNLVLITGCQSEMTCAAGDRGPQATRVTNVAEATHPKRLSESEIQRYMADLPGWTTDGQALFYERTFADFGGAIAFVNSLVNPAEELAHHPDITISYNRVSLQLTTHDAGGLTDLDFQLAQAIAQL